MTEKTTRRGYSTKDEYFFSGPELEKLKLAHDDLRELLDRGYKYGPAVTFVGSHYQLTARQRNALRRASASRKQCAAREKKRLGIDPAGYDLLKIDGFNLVIALETALSGSLLVLGDDNVLRDLAGLRGTYRLLRQTGTALDLIGKTLNEMKVRRILFYLDSPVSNSGRLRGLILAKADEWKIPVQVELVPNADRYLCQEEKIVTGDSVLLDSCRSWLNLSRIIIEQNLPAAWIVNFT